MFKKLLPFIFAFLAVTSNDFGQVNVVPAPCTTGSQNTCKCQNSPVLCSINQMNGFEYDMTLFSHPADGPTPMCPPPEGNGTSSQNPTWFSFLAWCTALTITVDYTACMDAPGGGVNYGIQAAIYSGCPGSAANAVTCDTDVAHCVNNGQRVLNISGLTVGQKYYFLVDGCAGSACHIKISVVGNCSQSAPTPMTGFEIFPNQLCKPNATGFFKVLKNESDFYYWYIDGTLVASGSYLAATNLNFNALAPGLHTVCVDGSLLPCFAESDPPPPVCRQICIAPSAANAGTINANTPVCPGTVVPISVTGQNTAAGFVENVFITKSNGEIILVVPNNGTTTSLTSAVCEDYKVYSYNFYSGCYPNAPLPVVGQNVSAIQDSCLAHTCVCDLKSKVVSFADNQAPVFVNPPASGTFACILATAPMQPLNYTDNCIPAGSVAGVETGGAGSSPCDGGTITRTWEKTDDCGNTRTYVQTINVSPVNIAAFINPPADVTVTCADNIPTNLNLAYTNGGTVPCLISGSVPAVVVDNYTPCAGGTTTHTWTFTDACNRTITHTRTITINPLLIPAFVNPPADITVDCSTIPPMAVPNLNYTNGMTGTCLISGAAPGIWDGGEPTKCGGQFFRKWTFTDVCNRTITHIQKVTVTPVPEGNFVNPPADITVPCNAIPANGITLTFSNNLAGNCLITAPVIPTSGGSGDQCGGTKFFAWSYTDLCMRTKVDTQFITIDPIPIPSFVNPPANITVTCENKPTALPVLMVKNNDTNCPITANVTATQSGMANECGGTITFNWAYTDVCNRNIAHTQVITVSPMPQAQFVNPPADITVNCNQVPTSGPSLQIKNTGLGVCKIDQTVPAVQSGSGSQCGGTITYTWTYTDMCNRTTTHVQNITINPIPEAAYVNPPADITVTCDLIPTSGPQLMIKNNDVNCPINQLVTPVQTGSATICGGTITYTWTFTDVCMRTKTHTQNVVVLPMPQAQFVNPPADITVNCNQVPTSGPSLQIKNTGLLACKIDQLISPVQSGSGTQCGGTITYTWTFTDVCNRTTTHVQTITINPIPEAAYVNPPADITVTCDLIPTSGPQLMIKNNDVNCPINQLVTPVQTGSATICGGTITYTWTFTDVCNRTKTHTQNVVVTPMPEGAFVNPPADITVTCNLIPSSAPTLQIKNNGPTGCNIDQMITPTQSGTGTICGGSITYTWTFTDACMRTKTHTQTITIIPMPPAVFINPPADITVACNLIPTSGTPLQVKNNGPVGCNIDQSVTPAQSGSATICGGTITYTWTFTDACLRTITHTQNVVVTPMPLPQFVNPPANITVNCDAIPAAGATLTVTNNGPASCNINTTVVPVQSGSATICGGTLTYTWTFTDACNRIISHVQTVTVTPMLPPQFVNPPANVTVSCSAIPASAPNLQVINNGPTGCKIDESIPAVLDGSPNACGGSFNYKWTFTDACNRTITHTQTITVTPTPQGAFQNAPSNELVACNLAPALNSFPSLNFTNGLSGNCGINATVDPVVTGNATACGGTIIATWTFTDFCNRTNTHVKTVTVSPAAQATFSTPPPNITVNCDALNNATISLNYNNGATGSCAIQGSVDNIRNGTATYCGGTLQDVWSFTDLCGRTITASRTITVNPAPKAAFTSLPANITLDCDDVIPAPNLSYDNNQSGNCSIDGIVVPIQSGNYNSCGGTVFMTWTFTDACNRTISHTQTITINPAQPPSFVNPPMDENLDCGGVNNPPQFIEVSNGITGPCGININAPLVSVTQSGNTYTNTWSYTNPCNNQVFTHVQKTTTIIAPKLFVANPDIKLCAGEEFDLSTIVVIDLNNSNPVISYHSSVPANASNEVDPLVTPNPGDVYFINGVNALGCEDVVNIYFDVTPPANAGGDGSAKVCNDGTILNLTTLLNGGAATTGSWKQLNGSNLNLSNPKTVNFLNIPAGNYTISYIVQAPNNCPGDTALFTIAVTQQVDLSLAGVACIIGGTYEVKVVTKANTVTSTLGQVQKLTNDTVRVFNITQGQPVTIDGSTANGVCKSSITINAPDCSCPFVPEPTGVPYYSSCEASALSILMTATVPAGMQASWFAVPSGGVALQANSLTYTHTNGLPNLYKYYVETYNPSTDCYSLSRLEVKVEVFPNPTIQNYTYNQCDVSNDSKESFDLSTVVDDVSSLSNTITFHLTLADAQNGVNALPTTYINTSNPQTLYVLAGSPQGCKKTGQLTLALWPSPITVVDVTPESCVGAKDGKIQLSNAAAGTYEYNLNNQGWTANKLFTGLEVGNYAVVTRDANGCTSQNNTNVDDGLLIVIKTFKIECDNKGTLSNPNDDVYKITVRVENNLGVAGNYSLTGDNAFTATYAYNTDVNFTLPANGSTIVFTVKDVLRGCTANRTIGPLTSCSTTCVADLKIISSECNGNNTASDPTDDYYVLKFSATALNGATNNQYNLYVDNVLKGLFTYGADHMINIPATNQLANIKIVDNSDLQCSDNTDIGPLNNCSDQCVLTAVIESIECKNPGSSPSPNDDFYEITIKASLVNGGTSTTYKILTESGKMFTGTYGTSLKITLPADNLPHKLTVIDNVKTECKSILDLNALTPCSGPCEVEVKIVSVNCSNNGTTNDSNDDTYEVTINAKLINGGTSDSYKATVDGKDYNGVYNKTLVIKLPADGKTHLISVIDQISAECKGSVQTDLLLPCSVPCNVNATVLTFDCNNGGTTSDVSDDTYTVSIMVNISNGGASTKYTATVDGKDYIGTYGQALVIPFKADNLVHDIAIKDNTNGVCTAAIKTPQLAPCSGPCTIDVVVSNVTCSNAGTNNTAEDDEYFFEILVTGNNTKWKINELNTTGDVGNKIKLGPFKIKDGISSFLVYFDNSPNCKKQVNITIPPTCSECKQTVDAGNGGQISCTQNSIPLSATSSATGNYAWLLNGQVVTNALTLDAGQAGKYYFQATYSDGCKAIDSVVITIDANLPQVDVTRGLKLTCQVKEVTLTGSATGQNLKYEWTDEAGNIISTELSIKVKKEGKYFFRAYNSATGCSSSKVVSEVIKKDSEPISIIYAKPTSVFDCVIKIITLFNNTQPDVTYTWQNDEGIIGNKPSIEISKIGNYKLIAVDTVSGCSSESNLKISSLQEYPIINLKVQDTLDCTTDKVFVSSEGSQVGSNITYEWKDKNNKVISSSQSGIDIKEPGIYYLVLKDVNNGCTNTDTVEVKSFENEIDVKIPLVVYVKEGDSIRLNTLINIPVANIKKITWTPKDKLSCSDCLNPIVVTNEDITYKVEIEDIFGCKGTAEVTLRITKQDVVTIPNIINTNSSSNNGFTLYGNEEVKKINKLAVYDRWGNLMFLRKDFAPNLPELGWKGTFNNKDVVPGVYVYLIEIDLISNQQKVFTGDVTVVR